MKTDTFCPCCGIPVFGSEAEYVDEWGKCHGCEDAIEDYVDRCTSMAAKKVFGKKIRRKRNITKEKKKILDFVVELEALSRKYKVAIYGCGCCGSPWIQSLEKDELLPDYGYHIGDEDGEGDSLLRWENKVV